MGRLMANAVIVEARGTVEVLDELDLPRAHLEPTVAATDLSQRGYFEHLSDAKMRRVIGWTPRLGLEEGLRLTYEWYAARKGWPSS